MVSFRKGLTSPITSLTGGYICIGSLAVYLYSQGYYGNSTLFTWGVPTSFMGKEITSLKSYYFILFLLFTHQLLNNWVSSVAYPWIINSVQNKDYKSLDYSRVTSVFIVLAFDVYSNLNMILLISGMASQIGFFTALLAADLVSSTVVNVQYLLLKEEMEETEDRIAIV